MHCADATIFCALRRCDDILCFAQILRYPVHCADAQDIVVKRLLTLAASCKAPSCVAEGFLAGVLKFEAMVSIIDTRKGSKSILAALSHLKKVVALAKTCIMYIHVRSRRHCVDEKMLDIRGVGAGYRSQTAANPSSFMQGALLRDRGTSRRGTTLVALREHMK